MKLVKLFSLTILLVLSCCMSTSGNQQHVNIVVVDNYIINPVVADFIVSSIEQSEKDDAMCLIIQLDTPGGLLESTRQVIKKILNAQVPVVVYISPQGARAGSAGVFITLASHIAAMAPATNIGAAHPVNIGNDEIFKKGKKKFDDLIPGEKNKDEGEDIFNGDQENGNKKENEEVEKTTVMSEKILNDTVAWVKTIAKSRGRNAEWAERSVRESESISETEALKNNVVEYISANIDDLLKSINGEKVKLPDKEITLATTHVRKNYFKMGPKQKFLNVIANPNIAYILMLLGFFGLLYEITHPGIGVPGIAGVICLILAFYSFHTLPLNYAGFFLIGLGIILFIFEVNIQSYGLLTLGGIIAMTLGSLMLIDTPFSFLRISFAIILPLAIGTGLIVVFLVSAVVRSQSRKTSTGNEGLVGLTGTADSDIDPAGKVFIHGEIWDAESEQSIQKGEEIVVEKVTGLKLYVKKKSI